MVVLRDARRREVILNILLIGTIFLLFLLGTSLLYNQFEMGQNYEGLPVPIFAFILAFFVVLYAISRGGYYLFSSYIFIFFFFAGVKGYKTT